MLQAIVQAVKDGKHGPYAVARLDEANENMVITISLSPPTWMENRHPQKGEILMVEDITKKPAGWRANHARFMRLDDKIRPSEPANGKEAGA